MKQIRNKQKESRHRRQNLPAGSTMNAMRIVFEIETEAARFRTVLFKGTENFTDFAVYDNIAF